MRARRRDDNSNPGQDSFLDIVANIVGILVILVMVAGVRAKSLPPMEPEPDAEMKSSFSRLEEDRRQAETLAAEIRTTQERIAMIGQESMRRSLERDQLALVVAAVEDEIAKRREAMGDDERQRFDRERQILDLEAQLAEVETRKAAVAGVEKQVVAVESLPTPLSQTVEGKELHFQLLGGRITEVPIDRLMRDLKARFRGLMSRMDGQRELGGSLGPLQGFRMTYVLEEFQLDRREAMAQGVRPEGVRLRSAQFIPQSSTLGEPIDAALAEGSAFRHVLSGVDPRQVTITIWTYQDSFAEFRRLKKILHDQGFAAAARPMTMGEYIGASIHGTKSRAE